MEVNLTDRQQHILWATVRHYIATAEPVGSKALTTGYNLGVSPATIRNVMNCLEKVGLLYQPHTSAGRIPSDSGYRLYVDQLITPAENLSLEVEETLREQLNLETWSLEAVLRGVAQVLSNLSGYITLITFPQTTTVRLRHVQLVQIEPRRVMLIVVTNTYETHSSFMELTPALDSDATEDPEIVEEELQILSNFLNSQLRGKTLRELSTLDWSELDREFQQYADFLRRLLSELSRRSQTPESTRILISGLADVLRLPEFSQLDQVKTLVQLLEEEQEQLWPLIFEPPYAKNHQVTIRIGSENPLEPIQSCTLISSTYQQNNIPVGSVGVLGPTRMAYENVIALVAATASYLSEALGTHSTKN